MRLPTGKGFYIWQIPRCGSIPDIVEYAKQARLGHIFIKIADGYSDYNIIAGRDLAKELADALKREGIEPWGWQYVYSYYPENEANKAIERIQETGVVGFDIDAESECKNRPTQVGQYCYSLRKGVGTDFPIGLGSYRFPSVHPELPWTILRSYCNFDMPQVYWVQAHNPGAQLRQSYKEFASMTRKLPYVATGSAYRQERSPYWIPTKEEITEFMATADDLGVPFNFWEWYDAMVVLPDEIWETIANWNNENPPPPQPLPENVVVTASKLYIRKTPYGEITGYVPLGFVAHVTGSVKDSQGEDWYYSGTGCYASWWTKPLGEDN